MRSESSSASNPSQRTAAGCCHQVEIWRPASRIRRWPAAAGVRGCPKSSAAEDWGCPKWSGAQMWRGAGLGWSPGFELPAAVPSERTQFQKSIQRGCIQISSLPTWFSDCVRVRAERQEGVTRICWEREGGADGGRSPPEDLLHSFGKQSYCRNSTHPIQSRFYSLQIQYVCRKIKLLDMHLNKSQCLVHTKSKS